jgi:ABC-2 type transport system ATP-binding protein
VIHSPEVLFLDEPFESIDPAGVALMKQWLRRFTEQGRTVFITSHVLETVERLCDRVAIITRPGKLVWQGDITVLAEGGAIDFDGHRFEALEPLFLHLTGERYADLNWL